MQIRAKEGLANNLSSRTIFIRKAVLCRKRQDEEQHTMLACKTSENHNMEEQKVSINLLSLRLPPFFPLVFSHLAFFCQPSSLLSSFVVCMASSIDCLALLPDPKLRVKRYSRFPPLDKVPVTAVFLDYDGLPCFLFTFLSTRNERSFFRIVCIAFFHCFHRLLVFVLYL